MIEDAKMPEPVAYQVLVEGGTEKFCVRADVADEFASRLRKDWGNNVEVRPLYSPDLLDYAQAEQKKRMEAEERVKELEMDAERYRWLRENTGWVHLYENCGIQGSDIKIMVSRKRLDSSIDSVLLRDQTMNAEKETKQVFDALDKLNGGES